MRRVLSVGGLIACVVSLSLTPVRADVCADFEDLPLPASGYWNGSDGSGGFRSQAVFFGNVYYTYPGWSGGFGFFYSSVNDTNTPGSDNQYAVISGTGVGGTGVYAVVADDSGYGGHSGTIALPVPCRVKGFYVNNTTYAYLEMRDGGFSKKFGGDTGNDPDWFLLTVTGRGAGGGITGTQTIYLADFRFATNTQDYLLRDWTWLSLTNLGPAVKTIEFALSSSDNGKYGMNTPAYFALDGLEVDPGSATADDAADWNGDGMPNLMAYALGYDMSTAAAGVLRLVATNSAGLTYVEAEYPRRHGLADASLRPAYTTNLAGSAWVRGVGHIEERVLTSGPVADTIRARLLDSATNAVGFVRLEATRP